MNIVILSYRISGNDGVSLECKHWKNILIRAGHKVTFIAGELDEKGILMPELHFQWPYVMELHDKVVYGRGNYKHIEEKVFDIAGTIEGKLRRLFNHREKIDLLIVANAFSLPMHFPLAVALKRYVEEAEIPTIARHHDFWWERSRYLKSHLFQFFERWFPPNLPNLKHVVINSFAKDELKKRTGVDSVVIADSFDFANQELAKTDSYSKTFRKDIGVSDTDIIFLQATRIVPRKRFEYSIKFMKKLNNPNCVFVAAGHSGDEGKEYEEKIKSMAEASGIRYKFIGDQVGFQRKVVAIANGKTPIRKKIYSLWDCYINSDFVLYPTKIEGFGNQFIEAVYFKKPIILTPYLVYESDIAPLGFETILMNGRLTLGSVKKTEMLLQNPKKIKEMTEKNFKLGKKYFSYNAAYIKIKELISSLETN